MLISYLQAERPMRPLYSPPPGFENFDKEKLERYKERMQHTLEELELEALSLNGIAMEKIRKVNELQLKAPLVVYPLQKVKSDADYNKSQKQAAIKEEQENKHKIDNIIYWLGELDVIINGLDEMVKLSSE
jgi:hypothetical protein